MDEGRGACLEAVHNTNADNVTLLGGQVFPYVLRTAVTRWQFNAGPRRFAPAEKQPISRVYLHTCVGIELGASPGGLGDQFCTFQLLSSLGSHHPLSPQSMLT